MNKDLKEALYKQRVRRTHRDALARSRRLNEAHPLWDAFVKPFTNAIDAVKLAGADILNALSLTWDTLFTLSPKKKKEALDRFKARQKDIEKEWEPIMKKADEALANSDYKIASFILNPAATLTKALPGKAYQKAKDLNTFLQKSGWKAPLVGTLTGMPDYQGPAQDLRRDQEKADADRPLWKRLAGLFYMEGAIPEADLLVEQEEAEKQAPKKPPLKDALDDYLDQTGLKDKINQNAKEFIEAQQEMVDTLIDDVIPRLTLASTLAETTDIDEFTSTLDEAAAQGLDLGVSGLDKTKLAVEEASQKLLQSEEFKKQVATQAKKPPEEITDDDLSKAASNVAFVNAKKSFEEQSLKGIDALRTEALAQLEELTPDAQTISLVSSTQLGAEYVKIFEDAKQKIESA